MQRPLFGNGSNVKAVTPTRLQITSWNASSQYSNTNFTDIFANGNVISDVKQIHLISATIPNLFPTFNDNDSVIQLTYKGSSYTIKCNTQNRYDVTAMLAHLNALLQAQSPLSDIVASFDTSAVGYKKLLFTHPAQVSAANDLKFVSNLPSNWKWGIINPVYTRGTTSPVVASTVACDGVIRELRTSLIYVRSSISNDATNSAGLENILGQIPVDVPWGDVIQFREFLDSTWIDCSVTSLSPLNIELLDEDFQQLTLPSNAYTSFQFDARNHYVS